MNAKKNTLPMRTFTQQSPTPAHFNDMKPVLKPVGVPGTRRLLAPGSVGRVSGAASLTSTPLWLDFSCHRYEAGGGVHAYARARSPSSPPTESSQWPGTTNERKHTMAEPTNEG